MEKHVYFVRHGEAESNVDHISRGPEAMLTEKGRQQANIVARRVKNLHVGALISSSYPRALDTATAIASSTGLVVEPSDLFIEWREPSAILHKPKDRPDIKAVQDAVYAEQDHSYRHSDEETFTELTDRGTTALEYLERHPTERLCVVTHGAFLRVLLGTITFRKAFTRKEFVAFFWNLRTHNTGITYATYDPEHGWRLVSWNDSAHLG